jgi:hypothetical protein
MPADTNHPPSPVELFREELDRFKAQAEAFGEITDANAQHVRDHIGFGGTLAKDIDKTREAEKKPHLDAGRKIDGAYKPLVDEADTVVKALKRKLAGWMEAREREAREKAAEAARKLAEAEAAAAKAAEPEDDPFLAATAEAAIPDVKVAHAEAKTAEMEALAASRVSSAAGGYRATSLKTIRKAKITDWSALAAHYVNNGELRATLERLANSDIRHAKGAEISIPGVEIVTERVL